jgi:DNA-binding NarL/FixJ family response regulator
MLAYLLLRDNIQSGPYSLEELKLAGIRSTDMLWIEGRSSEWRYVDEIEELQAFVDATKENGGIFSKSNNTLLIHHEEDDGSVTRQSNQADISPFLQTETNTKSDEQPTQENEKVANDRPEAGKTQEKVRNRALEIRERLLSRKERTPYLDDEKTQINNAVSSPSNPIRVIIADDHSLFREGVKIALAQNKDIKFVGEAENGAQLLQQLKHNRPDVILLDIQMPIMDGISALVSIRKLYGDMKVIMLSMHEGHSMVSTMMETGANAYLTKTADSQTIYQAIKTCYEKGFYFNDLTNVSMLQELRKKNRINERTTSPPFDGAHLMKQLTQAQKKSARYSYYKTNKRLFVASFSVLLIASGIVAGLSVLSHPKQLKPTLTPLAKKPIDVPQPIKASIIPFAQAQPVDSTQKKAVEEIPGHEKTNLLINDKKQIPVKHKQTRTIEPFKTASLLPVQKTDSISKANSSAVEKKVSSGADDLKAFAKNNIRSLVTVSVNEYHKGLFGGLSDIQLKVSNRSTYSIDQVIVEVQYMLAGSKLYKTETVNFENILPTSTLVLNAPKSTRGVKLDFRILSVRSKDLGL